MITGFAFAAAMAVALAPFADRAPPPRSGFPLILAGGCHSDAQTHHVPELRDTVRHRHLRDDCRAVPMRDTIGALDCHRDVRRHYVPGLGVVLHRHVGKDCSIRRVNRSSEQKP